jgi:hypothetical protein
MKKYSAFGAAIFCLVLLFQNCGKAPSVTLDNGTTTNTGVSSGAQIYNKFSAESFSTLSLWDFVRNRYLDLDIKTGQVAAFEEAGQVRGESFTLPPERMTELHGILAGAEVCEPVVDDAVLKDQVCTMAYRYPYATLVERGEEVKLGEKTDGCDIPVDLCDSKAEQLQKWTRSVVEAL